MHLNLSTGGDASGDARRDTIRRGLRRQRSTDNRGCQAYVEDKRSAAQGDIRGYREPERGECSAGSRIRAICDGKANNRTVFRAQVTVCCIDPEDYSRLPLTQFEEDNILREMNKSLLGFRQRHVPGSPTDPIKSELEAEVGLGSRRLSPIGESFSSTPPETEGDDKVFAMSNNSKTGGRPRKTLCNSRNLLKLSF
jgi:hypothetical protein